MASPWTTKTGQSSPGKPFLECNAHALTSLSTSAVVYNFLLLLHLPPSFKKVKTARHWLIVFETICKDRPHFGAAVYCRPPFSGGQVALGARVANPGDATPTLGQGSPLLWSPRPPYSFPAAVPLQLYPMLQALVFLYLSPNWSHFAPKPPAPLLVTQGAGVARCHVPRYPPQQPPPPLPQWICFPLIFE